jgi:hypothetical protein
MPGYLHFVPPGQYPPVQQAVTAARSHSHPLFGRVTNTRKRTAAITVSGKALYDLTANQIEYLHGR